MTPAVLPLPISQSEPCGPNLEYDHEFAVLLARLAPRADAQYGSFVNAAETPNWADIERDCQRLLLRTKDINLLVWLCRARTRLAHAAGLVQALDSLSAVLEAWPERVHPQLTIDGEREPALRANALAALADRDGLLGDVLDLAVTTGTVLRLTVRDVERALAIPRPSDGPSPDSVLRQLEALRAAASGQAQAPILDLARAAVTLRRIDIWCKSQLGDDAPSLQPLLDVLELFLPARSSSSIRPDAEGREPVTGFAIDAGPVGAVASWDGMAGASVRGRAEVLSTLVDARAWFETHEPSSPVAVLLRQAERLVGQRFSQVVDVIPLDLLKKWDAEDEGEATA